MNENTTEYWTSRLSGFGAPTSLVIDRVSKASPSERRQASKLLAPRIAREIQDLVCADAVRIDALLQLLWGTLLYRYSGEEDVVFGFDFSRGESEGSELILPVRIVFRGDGPVRTSLLNQYAEVESERQHLDVTLEEILAAAKIDDPQKLFESVVSWSPGRERPKTVAMPGGEWPALSISLVTGPAPALTADFSTARFHEVAIDRLLGHLETLLESLLERPDESLRKLQLLTEQERQRILVDWNRTAEPYPEGSCLHELFEQQVEQQPQAPAVVYSGRSLSYDELNRKSNQLAHRLIELGVGPDVPVGLSVGRTFEMVIGLMGILKAGGAYVPIDPSYPADRQAFLLDDSNAPVLVTSGAAGENLDSTGVKVLIGGGGENLEAHADTNPDVSVDPHDLAYVIYTSGSTGRPKGAVLNHRGRVNNFTDFNRRYRVGPGDVLLAVSSLSFDMTAYDVFGTLAAGATIVIVEDEARLEPARWAELVSRHRVSVWHSVPALLEMLVDYVEKRPELHPPSLRLVLLGGDWIPIALPDRLRALKKDVHVVAMGGATEVSMDSTIFDIDRVDPAWNSIPYGRPMANQLAYVLDRHLEPVPIGVAAELHLGGVGVGRGYWNRPDLTSEKFIPNPFVEDPDQKLYKTGDLARFGSDGNLELLGRMDFQVKIRGYRIELGEIEAALREHEAVKECVVLARKGEGREQRLVAYLLLNPQEPLSSELRFEIDGCASDPRELQRGRELTPALRRFLGDRIPEYMVPSAFVFLDRFPLTPNGKLNRKALPDPDTARPEQEQLFRETATEMEQVLGAIWADVLNLDRVGANDRFIPLGGSSLLATEVAASIQEIFSVTLSVREVFELDVSELANRVSELGCAQDRDLAPVARLFQEVSQLTDEQVESACSRTTPPESPESLEEEENVERHASRIR